MAALHSCVRLAPCVQRGHRVGGDDGGGTAGIDHAEACGLGRGAREEALAWLETLGHPATAASDALDAARGHPGLADAWLRDGGLDVRRDVAADLTRLARGDASASETAQRWAADEHARLRLRFAADHALAQAAGLTDPMRTRTLAQWFDAANRTHALLGTTVRADIAIAELLLAWQAQAGARASGGHGT
jgi:DNA polymerase-3 subunit delta'